MVVEDYIMIIYNICAAWLSEATVVPKPKSHRMGPEMDAESWSSFSLPLLASFPHCGHLSRVVLQLMCPQPWEPGLD